MRFECLQRVLVVGGAHDHDRTRRRKLLEQLEPVHAGHFLQIEKEQIRRESSHCRERGRTSRRLANDRDVRVGIEQQPNALAADRLVVDDEGTERLAHVVLATAGRAAGIVCHGIRKRTTAPPRPERFPNSNRWSVPYRRSSRLRAFASPTRCPSVDAVPTKPGPSSRTSMHNAKPFAPQ